MSEIIWFSSLSGGRSGFGVGDQPFVKVFVGVKHGVHKSYTSERAVEVKDGEIHQYFVKVLVEKKDEVHKSI